MIYRQELISAVNDIAYKCVEPFRRAICTVKSWLNSNFQGTIGDVFFIIRDGEVRITNDNPNGTEKEVARLGKSQYFGEAALIKVVTFLSILSFHHYFRRMFVMLTSMRLEAFNVIHWIVLPLPTLSVRGKPFIFYQMTLS